MGIALNLVYLLSQVLRDSDRSNHAVLTIGVQDCYFDQDKLVHSFKRNNIRYAKVPQSRIEYTTGFHHLSVQDRQRYSRNLHQRSLFEFLGYSKDNILSLDVNDYEGCDIVHDLNNPIPDSLRGRFDVVFDSGSVEHVFSTKDAFFNLARLCRAGGIVVQFEPVDMINHGFVNFNSYIFQDFYESNGFECLYLKYIAIPTEGEDSHFLEIDPFLLREPLKAPYYLAVFAAYRKVHEVELKVPMQSFYRDLFETSASDAAAAPIGAISTDMKIDDYPRLRFLSWLQDNFERIKKKCTTLKNTRLESQSALVSQPAPVPNLPPHHRIELL
jgi:SAM-dependent methyltransferase